MDRRSFLKSTSAAAAAATTAATAPLAAAPVAEAASEDTATGTAGSNAAPAIASGRCELTLALPWRDATAGPADRAHRIARRLEAALDGRWRIVLRHRTEDGIAALAAETADLYLGTENDNLPYHPAFAFFAALPGAGTFNAEDLVAWLRVGGGQELWNELAAGFGVKPFLAGHLGRWPGLWSARPIDSLADLEGARIAVEGLARDVVRGVGGEPAAIAADDMAAALAAGDIAAAEYGGPLASLELGLPGVARHIAGFGINEGGIGLSLGIRHALWDRLGATDRLVVAAVLAEETQSALAELRAHEKLLRALIRDRHGVTFRPLPSDVAIALDRVAEAVVADAGSGDVMARRIDRSYHAFRNAAWGVEGPQPPTPGV